MSRDVCQRCAAHVDDRRCETGPHLPPTTPREPAPAAGELWHTLAWIVKEARDDRGNTEHGPYSHEHYAKWLLRRTADWLEKQNRPGAAELLRTGGRPMTTTNPANKFDGPTPPTQPGAETDDESWATLAANARASWTKDEGPFGGNDGPPAPDSQPVPRETGGAPERIYLQVPDDCDGYADAAKGEVTWCADQINDGDIEYVRADLAARARSPGGEPGPLGWQACPVCGGRGFVPFHFYHSGDTSRSIADEKCRTCDGRTVLPVGSAPEEKR